MQALHESSQFRISVWRRFEPRHSLVSWDSGATTVNHQNMQMEVIVWSFSDSPFDCVEDHEARARLQKYLIEQFDPSLPPESRRCEKLFLFTAEAKDIMARGAIDWTQAQDTNNELGLLINPLLALTLHLEWVLDVFSSQPDISVSVR